MNNPRSKLTTTNHDRDLVGLKYVYPVLSRRAGGLSVGINFNTNNACNWGCLYCQVPDLKRGSAPSVDLAVLEKELEQFFDDVLMGAFFDRYAVAEDNRVIKDIALSGNGEPTSVKLLEQAIALIGRIAEDRGVFPESKFVLITNGSLIHQQGVIAALKTFNRFGGEIWFKLDSATKEGRQRYNATAQSVASSLANLEMASLLCKTKLQTCFFKYQNQGLLEVEKQAYLAILTKIIDTTNVNEVLLYTIARPSMQPEADKLAALTYDELNDVAEQIKSLGFKVSIAC